MKRVFRVITRSIIITIIIFYWTIARHEGSHALMAYLEGADICELRLIPGIHEELGFYFAYVKHSEQTTWLTEAAPYMADILLLLITISLLLWKKNIRYFNAIMFLGILSPFINLLYNYQGGLWREGTDVADLFDLLPDFMVHIGFVASMMISLFALYFLRKRRFSILR